MTGSGARPDPGSGDDATHDGPPAVRPVAGGRHEARERAVHLLYEAGIKGLTVDEVLAAQVLAPDPYTTDLVRGVAAHREELDELIAGLAKGWTLGACRSSTSWSWSAASSWRTGPTCPGRRCCRSGDASVQDRRLRGS